MNINPNTDKLALTIPWMDIERGAQKQIETVLELPFLKRLAIMPDVHQGYSLPIGGVALLDDVISPPYVGVDIGCGMCCVITDIPYTDIIGLEYDVKRLIESDIPVGFNSHKRAFEYPAFISPTMTKNQLGKIQSKIGKQLGTLGGGNHFIEIGSSQLNNICITIHSGSRGAGKLTADHFMKIADSTHKELPNGFIPLRSSYGAEYYNSMLYMTEYALANRKQMMYKILCLLGIESHSILKFINENHNYASVENNGVLHRKGATPAEKGQWGVIPGNMRDGVYITQGRGNEDFLCCASHGAGRIMSRGEAKRKLDVDNFTSQMEGIACDIDGRLDESPDAYKPIDEVIAAQNGILVDVIDHITTRLVVKG